jgi:EmrB/QacA subfamily drug resistance transporter
MSTDALRPATAHAALDDRRRWLALIVLCLGALMIMIDTTIVNVALPSIRKDLNCSERSLVWVVNAYLLTFGGSLLLAGRLGDLYGQRKLFLIGVALFTLASLTCGLTQTSGLLIAARGVQGLGGAIVLAVTLSLIINLFSEGPGRAKALGFYGFVCGSGGGVGLLFGGGLTSALNWHWIFLVNIPIGIAVHILCVWLVPRTPGNSHAPRLDVWGAILVTTSLMLTVYAIVNANDSRWGSPRTLGMLLGAAILMAVFLAVEARRRVPLVPLGIFRQRNLTISGAACALWAAGMSAWFFTSSLYMQLALGYGPMQVGLAYLPVNVIMAGFSFGFSPQLVRRFGVKTTLAVGMLIGAMGHALFARAPLTANIATDILPGMVLLGVGAGLTFNPLMLAAVGGAAPGESGLASGLINTASRLGGALGLAVFVSLSTGHTRALIASGASTPVALVGGYRVVFEMAAACAASAALLAAALLRSHAHIPAIVRSSTEPTRAAVVKR